MVNGHPNNQQDNAQRDEIHHGIDPRKLPRNIRHPHDLVICVSEVGIPVVLVEESFVTIKTVICNHVNRKAAVRTRHIERALCGENAVAEFLCQLLYHRLQARD